MATSHKISAASDHITEPMNVLLTNGRFPVTIDLARQLGLAKANVYVVDPMEFHVCKFSKRVKKSWQTPAPSEDPAGYIRGVKKVLKERKIDLIIPLHEEIFYLAESPDDEIRSKLFAPDFKDLYRLHHKWEFSELLKSLSLDCPEAYLCKSIEDIKKLPMDRDWGVKPCLGRSSTGVHHLKAGRSGLPEIDIAEDKPHIAQEWLKGNRFCTYGIFRQGKLEAFSIYPVMETIDGSSSVYFEAVEHDGIKEYVRSVAAKLKLTGQLAFDFIETGVEEGDVHRAPHGGTYRGLGRRKQSQAVQSEPASMRDGSDSSDPTTSHRKDDRRLVSVECNPRATSGIHLWSRSPQLAAVMTDTTAQLPEVIAQPGTRREVAPGMMMWEHKNANSKRYLEHLGRLFASKDVMWSWSDPVPMLMQPFLLASYYRICHDRGGQPLPEMFQSDLVWEPGMYGQSKKLNLAGGALLEAEDRRPPSATTS